jgi:hypothetical protein
VITLWKGNQNKLWNLVFSKPKKERKNYKEWSGL